MIPIQLQKALKEKIEEWFKDVPFETPDGTSFLNVYEQRLPTKKGRRDTEQYPCVIVRVEDGEDPGEEEAYNCKVTFMAGSYYNAESTQGHEQVMFIMQRVYQRLKKHPIIDGKYENVLPIKWALTEEDYHPYYFGGIETTFELPKQLREDVTHLL